MKTKNVLILVGFIALTALFTVPARAQSFDGIAGAIRSGNASALAANFQGNVEITIKDASQSYSKTQAEIVLKDFFAKNQPKAFSVAHEGTSPEGSKYFVGNLTTSGGTYRTYVYAKVNGASLSIQEIRFEAQ